MARMRALRALTHTNTHTHTHTHTGKQSEHVARSKGAGDLPARAAGPVRSRQWSRFCHMALGLEQTPGEGEQEEVSKEATEFSS